MVEVARPILAIDVGNSTTTVALVQLSGLSIDAAWRMSTQADRLQDEWRSILSPLIEGFVDQHGPIAGSVIASVVPRVTWALGSMVLDWFGVEPLIVDATHNLGIGVAVDYPLDVGADRLVNAVAAKHLVGAPAIIVDVGTATKIDVVSAQGDFLGGAIAPGIGIGLDALAARAAQLYAVEITLPRRAIGRGTVEAIQSGLVLGHVAMIEGIVARVRAELNHDPPVIVTGGFGELLSAAMSFRTRREPHLTLVGAALVWSRELDGVMKSSEVRA
ncbi:MAG: type III pantothenate kinase [Thermomicrobiales bacterium]